MYFSRCREQFMKKRLRQNPSLQLKPDFAGNFNVVIPTSDTFIGGLRNSGDI